VVVAGPVDGSVVDGAADGSANWLQTLTPPIQFKNTR